MTTGGARGKMSSKKVIVYVSWENLNVFTFMAKNRGCKLMQSHLEKLNKRSSWVVVGQQ